MAPSLLDPSPTGFNILNTNPMQTHLKDDIFKPKNQVYVRIIPYFGLIHSLYNIHEPKGFKSAAKNPGWKATMDDEIQALWHNNIWNLVPQPTHNNVVGYK